MVNVQIQAVPNMMIDYSAFKVLRFLSVEQKAAIVDAVADYFENARYENAEVPSLPVEYPSIAKNAYVEIIQSVDAGIEKYRETSEKQREKANKRWNKKANSEMPRDSYGNATALPRDNHGTATAMPGECKYNDSEIDATALPRDYRGNANININLNNSTTKKLEDNIDTSLFGSFSLENSTATEEQTDTPDEARTEEQGNTTTEKTSPEPMDIMPEILKLLMENGFDRNSFDTPSISKIYGMTRDGTLTLETAREVVERCKQDGKTNLPYFFFMLS